MLVDDGLFGRISEDRSVAPVDETPRNKLENKFAPRSPVWYAYAHETHEKVQTHEKKLESSNLETLKV